MLNDFLHSLMVIYILGAVIDVQVQMLIVHQNVNQMRLSMMMISIHLLIINFILSPQPQSHHLDNHLLTIILLLLLPLLPPLHLVSLSIILS